MPEPSFLDRLKQRKIIQWALAYLAGAFVAFQLLDALETPLSLTPTIQRGFLAVVVVGFFITLVLAWYHGEKGRQRVSGPELLMVAALLVVAGVALSMLGGEGEVAGPTEAEPTALVDDGRPSIAVLPFEDHSPNPEDAWFADGIQDDIRTALRGISGLSLRAQSSVDRFREERPPVRDMASILGVAFLIEGSARIIEDQVRVIVHLIDGQADEEVWSETYDTLFSMPAVTAIQGNIAHRVAREVGARIAPTEEVASATLPTEDLGAYRLIHQARVLWNQRRVPEIREAVGLYEEAIRRDSQYADAYAGLGEASLYLGIFSLDRGEQIDAFRRAVTASERALELSPQMGGPHAVLGGVDLWYEGNREGAEQELTTAIALEPDHAFAHYWYSMYLNSLGRHEEALRELSIAQRLDPLAQAMSHGPAKLYFHARDYDRAVAEALKDLEVNPDYNTTRFFLCLSYLKLGSLDKARDPCETAQERNQVGDPLVGLYHAVAGDEAAARREVERELEAYGRPTLISIDVFAVLGDIDEAIRVLRRMQELDPLIQIQLGVDPFLDPLRSDPRFIQILRDMGLEG